MPMIGGTLPLICNHSVVSGAKLLGSRGPTVQAGFRCPAVSAAGCQGSWSAPSPAPRIDGTAIPAGPKRRTGPPLGQQGKLAPSDGRWPSPLDRHGKTGLPGPRGKAVPWIGRHPDHERRPCHGRDAARMIANARMGLWRCRECGGASEITPHPDPLPARR